MNQPPILTIQMVPAGVELVLKALSRLSIEEAGGLFGEIKAQAEYQLQELAAQAQQVQQPQSDAAPADDSQTQGDAQ